MFFRLRRAVQRTRFNWQIRALSDTAPLPAGETPFTLVSMVCHGEARMYILAVKSFCFQLKANPAIVVLNDGSLTRGDITLMQAHVPGMRVIEVGQVRNETCPKGNCWERLLLISDLSQASYIVQLDSDTLSAGPMDEVAQCIAANRSFTLLGDRSHPEVEPMLQAWERLRNNQGNQVQGICERNLNRLPDSGNLFYVRGNAGFCGFAQGSLSRERIAWFSENMRTIAEGTWDAWGSEQITSNLLIANTVGCMSLPAPKYTSHWAHPEIRYDQSAFVHWIGPFRFAFGRYARLARNLITRLPK